MSEALIEGVYPWADDRYVAIYDGRVVAVNADEAEARRAWHVAEKADASVPTQADVLAWVTKRWPDRGGVVWRAVKFGEESGEVLGTVFKESIGLKTKDDIAQESAQAALCLMMLAEAVGFDLRAAIATEWEACATRVWEASSA